MIFFWKCRLNRANFYRQHGSTYILHPVQAMSIKPCFTVFSYLYIMYCSVAMYNQQFRKISDFIIAHSYCVLKYHRTTFRFKQLFVGIQLVNIYLQVFLSRINVILISTTRTAEQLLSLYNSAAGDPTVFASNPIMGIYCNLCILLLNIYVKLRYFFNGVDPKWSILMLYFYRIRIII